MPVNRRGLGGLGGALLQTRLGVLEARLLALAGVARGCTHCLGWPAMAVVYAEEVRELQLQRDGDPGPAWPPELRCPRCGREPQDVVRVVYAETWPPGGRPA